MLFSTLSFWLLVTSVLALTLLNQRFLRSGPTQNVIFLFASFAFYAGWDWRFFGLIVLSTVLDYTAARVICGSASARYKRTALAASIFGNLGLLALFKYLNFFVQEATELLTALGFDASPTTLQIILPVGISFYTLQTLSYTIDVYRGTIPSERNLLRYATYVTFFPQLLAGPIERAGDLLGQFARFNPVTWSGVYRGLCLILVGLFLKICIADNLAPIVDTIFATHEHQNGGVLALGAIYFTVQIYGDFCGYSTIALGVAALFGVRLSTNFSTPLLASSIREFWKRWHITLYKFLLDYIYVPLGGRQRWARNIMILFAISGVWHGANWTFVVWGLFNGVAVVLAVWITRVPPAIAQGRRVFVARTALGWIVTQAIVVTGFTIFRAPDLATATSYFTAMVNDPSLPDTYRTAFKYVLMAFAIDLVWRRDVSLTRGLIPQLEGRRLHRAAEAALITVIFTSILVTGIAHADRTAFIYFQF